jgi:hypothetical protein
MNTEASLINQQPAVRCPWLGKEIENQPKPAVGEVYLQHIIQLMDSMTR